MSCCESEISFRKSSEIIRKRTIGLECSPMDNPPLTEEAICSHEDVSAELSARTAVLCACRHESVLGILVCL